MSGRLELVWRQLEAKMMSEYLDQVVSEYSNSYSEQGSARESKAKETKVKCLSKALFQSEVMVMPLLQSEVSLVVCSQPVRLLYLGRLAVQVIDV